MLDTFLFWVRASTEPVREAAAQPATAAHGGMEFDLLVGRLADLAQARGSGVKGKWRFVQMLGYEASYLDMVEPANILFDGNGGEFAFDCVTGAIRDAVTAVPSSFAWDDNNEMDEAGSNGWANYSPMSPSLPKSTSIAAMKPTSRPTLGQRLKQLASLPSPFAFPLTARLTKFTP